MHSVRDRCYLLLRSLQSLWQHLSSELRDTTVSHAVPVRTDTERPVPAEVYQDTGGEEESHTLSTNSTSSTGRSRVVCASLF